MPRLRKHSGHPNLYTHADSGKFYVKVYNLAYGDEICRSLKTKDEKRALRSVTRVAHELSLLEPGIYIDEFAIRAMGYKKTKAPNTYESFKAQWNLHLRPYFTTIKVSEVERYWNAYKAHCKQESPTRKLRHDREALRYVLGVACKEGAIAHVPQLPIDRSDRTPKRGRIISNAEIGKLKEVAHNPRWRIKIDLYRLGMRSGEVSQLKYADIDMTSGFVTIRKETTKNREHGVRTFLIPKPTLQEIKKRFLAGEGKSPYLFPHRFHLDQHETRTDKWFQRIKRESKQDIIRHHFRHTAASTALRAGVNPLTVKKTLGMSERVLNDVYHHVSEQEAREVARAISRGSTD